MAATARWGGLLLGAAVLLGAALAQQQEDDYAFVVLSDIHIGEGYPRYDGTDSYSNIKVREAIAKVNSLVAAEDIRFAFVTGDLTDSAEPLEFDVCRRELDALNVHVFPVQGNHDTWPYDGFGNNPTPDGDVYFAKTFADLFQPPFPPNVTVTYTNNTVVNPEFENVTSWFQNYVVRSGDLILIVLDWNTRQAPRRPGYEERGVGPTAQIHDFPGGTLQWLDGTLAGLAASGTNFTEIVFLQHHPYTLQIYAPDIIYGFAPEKKREIQAVLQRHFPLSAYRGVMAGHLHRWYVGTAFTEPGWEEFTQWETDTCKGHERDYIPKDEWSGFSLVRVRNGRIAEVEQFLGPY